MMSDEDWQREEYRLSEQNGHKPARRVDWE
jgi:hypothetical protein